MTIDQNTLGKVNEFAKEQNIQPGLAKNNIVDLRKNAAAKFKSTSIDSRSKAISPMFLLVVLVIVFVYVKVKLWEMTQLNEFSLSSNLSKDKLANSIANAFK